LLALAGCQVFLKKYYPGFSWQLRLAVFSSVLNDCC